MRHSRFPDTTSVYLVQVRQERKCDRHHDAWPLRRSRPSCAQHGCVRRLRLSPHVSTAWLRTDTRGGDRFLVSIGHRSGRTSGSRYSVASDRPPNIRISCDRRCQWFGTTTFPSTRRSSTARRASVVRGFRSPWCSRTCTRRRAHPPLCARDGLSACRQDRSAVDARWLGDGPDADGLRHCAGRQSGRAAACPRRQALAPNRCQNVDVGQRVRARR